jgi:hypothetical protein
MGKFYYPKVKTVWVVEIQFPEWPRNRWESTVGSGLNREDGRKQAKIWAKRNDGCRVRLKPYRRYD